MVVTVYSDVKSLFLPRTGNGPTLRSTGLAMDSLSSPAFFRFLRRMKNLMSLINLKK